MGQMINVQRINVRDAVKDMQGFTMGGNRSVGIQNLTMAPVFAQAKSSTKAAAMPKLDPSIMQAGLRNLHKAINESDDTRKMGYTLITDGHGHFQDWPSTSSQRQGGWWKEVSPALPKGWNPLVNFHVHPIGSWSFSEIDRGLSRTFQIPIFKNHDRAGAFGDIFYQEQQWAVDQGGAYAGDIH